MNDNELRSLLIACDSELSAICHGRPPSDTYALATLYGRVRKCYEAMPKDSEQPIDGDWLIGEMGFDAGTIFYTKLLPPVNDGAAIIEVGLMEEEDGSWSVDLRQGVPDDQHVPDDQVTVTSKEFRTRSDVRKLLAGITA
jgi:hypothetical protein